MAPLTKQRCTGSMRPFTYTSVDFAGPFFTKQTGRRAKEKRYLCLFTCLEVRAVHLEIAYSLDTDSFINALIRFISRRGTPQKIYSDNGRNFVGASNEINRYVSNISQNKIAVRFNFIEWSFLPPFAPHFGGAHESLVKSAKRAVVFVLGKAEIYDEELQTAFAQVESLLNSRPLSYQSDDSRDPRPLTPNNFLFGSCGNDVTVVDKSVVDLPHKRWQRVQLLVDHVWRRWSKEWLSSLRLRSKWRTETDPLNLNDVVLVHQPAQGMGKWLLGIVVKLHPGSDGHTRVVEVKTESGVYTRPLNRLSLVDRADRG